MISNLNDDAYFLDLAAPTMRGVVRNYAERSRALAGRTHTVRGVAYGQDHPSQTFSVVWPAQRGSTTLAVVFFHGGWWKAGNQQDRLFLAETFLAENIALVSVGYPLTPECRLDMLATGAVQAVQRAAQYLEAETGRQLPIVICGNSAGGHLAAYAAGTLAGTDQDASAHGIRGLCVASGLYELEPLRHSFVNGWLDLSEVDAAALSPVHRLPTPSLPVMVAVGEHEPVGFLDQQQRYLARLRAAGSNPQSHRAPGHDHFTLIGEIGRVGNPLHDWILQRCFSRSA